MDDVNWSELERLVAHGQISRRVLLRRLLEAGGIAAVMANLRVFASLNRTKVGSGIRRP